MALAAVFLISAGAVGSSGVYAADWGRHDRGRHLGWYDKRRRDDDWRRWDQRRDRRWDRRWDRRDDRWDRRDDRWDRRYDRWDRRHDRRWDRRGWWWR